MHLNAKRPVLAPYAYWSEIEKMSKAALMDLVWDLATTNTQGEVDDAAIMETLRERAKVVMVYRA